MSPNWTLVLDGQQAKVRECISFHRYGEISAVTKIAKPMSPPDVLPLSISCKIKFRRSYLVGRGMRFLEIWNVYHYQSQATRQKDYQLSYDLLITRLTVFEPFVTVNL